jgi:hypothetical protein
LSPQTFTCRLCGQTFPVDRVYFFRGKEWSKRGLRDGDAVCDQCITRVFPPIQPLSDPMQPSPDAPPQERLRWEYGRRERQLLEEIRRAREERDRLAEEVRKLRGVR